MGMTQNADGSFTIDRSPLLPPVTISAAQYQQWLGNWARFYALIDPKANPVAFNQPPVPASDPSVGGKAIPGTSGLSFKNPA